MTVLINVLRITDSELLHTKYYLTMNQTLVNG